MTAKLLAVASGGGAGDLLAATPAMRALQRRFNAPVWVLASPYAAGVLQDQPFVGGIVPDDGGQSADALATALREHAFSHAVVFWPTARVAAAVRKAGIAVRVGPARRLYSWSFTQRVAVRSEAGDKATHWTDVLMDYARALGAVPEPEDYTITVRLRPSDRDEAAHVLSSSIAGPYVVFHAARGGIALDRVRWPVNRFAAVADAVARAFSLPVVLTGAERDRTSVAAIAQLMESPHAAIAGRTTLMGLAAVLAGSSLVVALDSGPMHIAAALGVPTVGIFALRKDLPDRWRPLGPRVALVRPAYPCPPWHRKETCRSFACYANLSPQSVVAAARSLFASAEPAAAVSGP